jgi:carbamoyl-phosphate synthase large subunit
MAGTTLAELGFVEEPHVPGIFVKAPVFPFRRFPGVDPVLGPEMKSTGEVMGSSSGFGAAFAKAWLGAGHQLPREGKAFLSVNERDKPALVPVARHLRELGFELVATGGTAEFLRNEGLEVGRVRKVHEGRPSVVDLLINREIALVVNTPLGRESHEDDAVIRQTALKYDIPCITTLSGATAAAEGIAALQRGELGVLSLQEFYAAAVAAG